MRATNTQALRDHWFVEEGYREGGDDYSPCHHKSDDPENQFKALCSSSVRFPTGFEALRGDGVFFFFFFCLGFFCLVFFLFSCFLISSSLATADHYQYLNLYKFSHD